MAAWPTLMVASYGTSPLAIAASATKAKCMAAEAAGVPVEVISVEEVPLCDAVKVSRVPRGPLPGSSPAPALTAPSDEPVAPARRGDPETARKAAAAARRLGPNRRTEYLRKIVRDRDYGVGRVPGFTASEVCAAYGGEPGTVSKRLGELIEGAWLYVEGERPSITTGTPQRVVHPTHGAIQWCAENPR